MPTDAYIGMGSNLGDRAATLARAVELLRATPGVLVTAVSSTIETAAVGGPAGSPDFLNAVAAVTTTLSAGDLLSRLLEIERLLGRPARHPKWGPRVIDLDLLLYGDAVIDDATGPEPLVVPHPHLASRRFVLAPLAEIAPSVRHPLLGRTAAELLDAIGGGP